MTRVHVPGPLASGALLPLERATSDHLLRVLRLAAGAPLVVFDGTGGEYRASLERIERHTALVRLGPHAAVEREAPVAITLLQGLARGERMDWVVQKATELGVVRIVPIAAGRSVVRLDTARAEGRVAHWRAVAASACEQCGRNRVPEIDAPATLDAACAAAASLPLRLVLLPGSGVSLRSLGASLPSTALLVGPEGGFTDEEVALARARGFTAIALGPRVLRTETAGIAALAALGSLFGDLG